MFNDNDLVLSKLQELIKCHLGDEKPSSELLIKLFRLLRISNQIPENHCAAVKQKIKQYILSETSTNVPENVSLVRFDKSCDLIIQYQSNAKILNSFLLVLEPFCGQQMQHNTSILSKPTQIPIHKSRFDSIDYLKGSVKTLQVDNIDSIDNRKHQDNIDRSLGFNFDKQSEMEVIQSLLYIFQGISSKLIKYDSKTESFVLDPNLNISASLQDTIYSLCELGWLYLQVSKYVKVMEKPDVTKGLTMQALGFALQHELQDYFRLLAVLEQELNLSMINSQDGKPLSRLTLLRLRSWLQDPIERMSLLAHLTYGLRSLSGGALLSLLHAHTKHGDTTVSEVVVRIMKKVCVPFYHILSRWIFFGELNDVYFEFFVGLNLEMEVSSENIWHDCYFLRKSMIPTFFPQSLVNTIFVIGKSINFISRYRPLITESKVKSGDVKRVNRLQGMPKPTVADALGFKQVDFDAVDHYSTTNRPAVKSGTSLDNSSGAGVMTKEETCIESELQDLGYGSEARLTAVVNRMSTSINQNLLQMMIKDFYLFEHLSALKKFVLLGQGDFVTCLMDSVGPELQKSPSKLYRHNLSGILDGSLRSSNAQFEPTFVLNRVLVRLLESRPGDTGWEVFTLDYAIDAPLNAVVHSDAIAKYRLAFHMLWRLKRVEWTLSSSWKQIMTLSHSFWKGYGSNGRESWRKDFPTLIPIFHRCNLIRSRMMHVVNNLSAYLMFEVLESAWLHLQSQMKTAKCLDDIIIAHDNYLSDILDRGLLTPAYENLNMQVQLLLQTIFRFCNLEVVLMTEAAIVIEKKRFVAKGKKNADLALSGSTPTVEIDTIPEHMVERVDETANIYTSQLDTLMNMLKEHSETSGDSIKYLTFRLDFNNFYTSKLK